MNFLFIAVIHIPLSIQKNILTLYNNCHIILATYMLDLALEPSDNLWKNLLLLPWILNLIVDMVNDSTSLILQLKTCSKVVSFVILCIPCYLSSIFIIVTLLTLYDFNFISMSPRLGLTP